MGNGINVSILFYKPTVAPATAPATFPNAMPQAAPCKVASATPITEIASQASALAPFFAAKYPIPAYNSLTLFVFLLTNKDELMHNPTTNERAVTFLITFFMT